MKKRIGMCAAIAAMVLAVSAAAPKTSLSQQAAESKVKVGMIDFDKVIREHPVMVRWQIELETTKDMREKEMEKKIKENFGITDQTELSEEQRAQIQRIIMQESQKFTAEMEPKQLEKMKVVEEDVKEVGAVIATEKKLDLVVLRHIVVFGATDISDAIIERIKKKYN